MVVIVNLASKEAYQRFRPYFQFAKLQDGEQYELDTETRRLFVFFVYIALPYLFSLPWIRILGL